MDSNVESLAPNVESSDPNVETTDPNVESLIRKRISRDELEKIIIAICATEFLTLDQIAKRISRKATYIQNHILPDLIKSKKIIRQFPEINHPNQAYKAAK